MAEQARVDDVLWTGPGSPDFAVKGRFAPGARAGWQGRA